MRADLAGDVFGQRWDARRQSGRRLAVVAHAATLPGSPYARLAEIQHPIIDAYLEALPSGCEPRIMASRSVFAADERGEALHLADIGLRQARETFIAGGHAPPGDALADMIAAFDVHVGTPDDVITSLRTDSTLERVTDLIFQAHSIDPPHACILRSIELIAEKVAPALGWIKPAAIA
jgi:alkanesulfonate monooxygenase SsuD/methylene tetrahydromethanopterin reductase-like flavin-dependent oxidoreductase (luciferase family)